MTEGNSNNNLAIDRQLVNNSIRSQMEPPPPPKPKPSCRDYSYVYLIMKTLNDVGIARMSAIIKAIADVQKILDQIMDDLNQLKQLLLDLQNLGWGYDDKTGVAWDPSTHTELENKNHMADRIKKWLNDVPNGGVSNSEKMRNLWKELFYGDEATKTKSLTEQLKDALENPAFIQQTGSAYDTLKALNTSSFAGDKGDWVVDFDEQDSFLHFLRGDPTSIETILNHTFCSSYYKQAGITPKDQKTKSYTDDIGNVNEQFDSSKGLCNGLNTTQSTTMSMYIQQLTSEIQIAQQMIQKGGEETKAYTNNQIAH